jgi:hypothetical protein
MTFICNVCKKEYKSYQSLWNHNHKYHTTNNKHLSASDKHENQQLSAFDKQNINKLACKYCKKIFKHLQSRWRHEKTCNTKKQNEIENNTYKQELQKLKKDVEKLKNHKPTKKVININNGVIANSNTNSNNNLNNNSNNKKITINKTGTENILELNDTEVTDIFNKEIEGVIKLIELLNFNERLPSNHSFCTTALESSYLSTYNTKTNTIDKDRKKYFFDELFTKAVERQEILYTNNKNKFKSSKRKQIEDNIENLKAIKNSDFNNKIIKELMKKLNLLTYNKRTVIQNTWSNNNNSDSDDDDYFKNLMNEDLDDSNNQNITYKNNSDNDDTDDSDNETSEERPQLVFSAKSSYKKNIRL